MLKLIPVTERDRAFLIQAVSRIEKAEYVEEHVDQILWANQNFNVPTYYRNQGAPRFYIGGHADSRDVFLLEASSVMGSPVYIPAVLKQYMEKIQKDIKVNKFKAELAAPQGQPQGALERILRRMGFGREGCLKMEGFDPQTRQVTNAVILSYFPKSRRNVKEVSHGEQTQSHQAA
jgi:hypothetical protein